MARRSGLGQRGLDILIPEKNAGGKKKDAPQDTGLMFLPKENILHCLIYGRTDEETIRTISDLKKYISL